MSVIPISGFETPWAAAYGAVASVAPAGPHRDATTAGAFTFPGGAPPGEVSFTPPAALDLTTATELRFWLRVPRTVPAGFPLIFGYEDAADPPGTVRRWRIPVGRPGWWEQVRIGLEAETRGAATRFLFSPDGAAGLSAEVGELIAARPEMFVDVEAALVARLDGIADLPALAARPLSAPAAVGDGAVIVAETPGFVAGTLALLDDGGGGTQRVTVASAATAGRQTTLTLAPGDTVAAAMAVGTATVTALARIETADGPPADPAPPALRLTLLDAREDRRRTQFVAIEDSFRVGPGGGVTAATRPSPQGWLIDYQLTAEGPDRFVRLALLDRAAERVNFDDPLRVAGALTPLEVFMRPELPRGRDPALRSALHLRISAQREAGRRSYGRLSENVELAVAPEGAPAEPVRLAT